MIVASSLTKFFGDFKAVNDISFSVNDGEITGLLGPNGAGKTTTMRMLTGYYKPSGGCATIGGVDIQSDPSTVKKLIGYLPESAPLYSDMFVYDYLRYAAEVHGIGPNSKRIDETAGVCGLIDVMHKNIGELSKGYRQRVGLAHAMIHDPKVLILDEPTSGLDPNQIIEIRNLIREIGRKKTVILSTHILPEVEATCDRVIIINKGTIAADSRTSELRSSFEKGASIKVIVSGVAYNDLAAALKGISGVTGVVQTEASAGFTSGTVSASRDIREDIFKLIRDKGWSLQELARESNTLENIFRDLTAGGSNE